MLPLLRLIEDTDSCTADRRVWLELCLAGTADTSRSSHAYKIALRHPRVLAQLARAVLQNLYSSRCRDPNDIING